MKPFKQMKGLLKSKKGQAAASVEVAEASGTAPEPSAVLLSPTEASRAAADDSSGAPEAHSPRGAPAKSEAQPPMPLLAASAAATPQTSDLRTHAATAPQASQPAAKSQAQAQAQAQEAGDDFNIQQGTLAAPGPGSDIPGRLSELLDGFMEVAQQLFGVAGYTMLQDMLRWSMLLQIFAAVCITYLLASFHFWAVVGIPMMIVAIWLIWIVHLKSVTTVIRTQTRLDFILSGLMPEKESAWWLNMVVRACWPVFLRGFLNKTVVPKLAPWFLNKYKPPVLLRVDVLGVDMGDRGPVVSNVRVLQGVAGDSHVELEMDLEVASAENMFIQCGAKIMGMSAITWEAFVTGMHLTGTIRVGLKFSSTLPFVDRVAVMFPTPPQLSCAIKVMGGIDAASMPVAASYVEATLQAALNAALVWPNRILVVDAVKAVAFLLDLPLPPPEETDTPGEEGAPVREVKLRRQLTGPRAATAVVEVVEAEDLVAMDTGGTSDPYVKGSLGMATFTTHVQFKTLAPKWSGEKFELPVPDWVREDSYTLHLKVRDHDKFSQDDDLGDCSIDLRKLRGGLSQTLWLELQNIESGTLCMKILIKDDTGLSEGERQQLLEAKKKEETLKAKKLAGLLGKVDPGAAQAAAGMLGSLEAFDPKSAAGQAGSIMMRNYRRTAERLVKSHVLPKSLLGGDVAAMVKLEIVEGQNLIVADRGGTSDPYVKASLGRAKFQTEVVYKNLNPKWLSQGTLPIKKWPAAGEPCTLHFEVWDRDRSMKDDFMGKADVDVLALRDGKEQTLILPLQGVASGTIRVIVQVIDLEEAAQEAPEAEAPMGPTESEREAAELTLLRKEPPTIPAKPPGSTSGVPKGSDYAHMGVLVATKTPASISAAPVAEVATGPAQPAKSFVKVEVIEAQDLEAKDASGTSDPFVKAFIGSVQFQTKVVSKTLNPKWYEAYKMPVVEWHADATSLVLEVYDRNSLVNNVNIGRCVINLNKFRDGMRHDLWLRLENAKSGKIRVAITDLDDTLEIRSELLEVIPGVLVESWKVQSEFMKAKVIQA